MDHSSRTIRYTDGQTSQVHTASLDIQKQGLHLVDTLSGNILGAWSFSDLHVTQDWIEPLGAQISHKRILGVNLKFDNKVFYESIKNLLDKRDQATFIVPVSIKSILITLFCAVAVVVVGYPIYTNSVEKAADFISPQAEKKFGDLQVTAFAQQFDDCHDKEAERALDKIIKRLTNAGDLKGQKIDIHLYKTDMVNAFALPGNNMAILSGFLNTAQSEEEIAGVLAHELGHISHRDALRLALQSQGYALMSQLMTGSSGAYNDIAQYAGFIQTMSYSRSKENKADDYASTLLAKANYSTRGLAVFLDRMVGGKDAETYKRLEENLSFLSTHPATQERVRKLEALPITKTRPALSKAEFQALKNACRNSTQQAPLKK